MDKDVWRVFFHEILDVVKQSQEMMDKWDDEDIEPPIKVPPAIVHRDNKDVIALPEAK